MLQLVRTPLGATAPPSAAGAAAAPPAPLSPSQNGAAAAAPGAAQQQPARAGAGAGAGAAAAAAAGGGPGAGAPAAAREWGEFLHAPGKVFTDFDRIRSEIAAETERVAGPGKAVSDKPIRLKICSPSVL